MSDEKKVKAFVVNAFNDAGTGQNFTAGVIIDLPEGVFGNYQAAGLVRVPTAEDKVAPKAA
ncbi:MAG: hypothetical protein U5M50_02275 [Sphingobium sp.]|nr:hypothetical protein [Sphingobium sp.]